MSLGERISRGVTVTFGANLLNAIANAVLVVILARYLSPDGYGLLFFALSVLGVITLVATLGIPSSVARYVTDYVEKDERQVPHILTASLVILVFLSVAVGLITTFGSPIIARLLGEPNLDVLLVLGIGYVLLWSMKLYLTKVFQGFNRVEYSAAVNSIFAICHVLFAVAFVLLGYGAFGALAGYIVGLLVAVVVGFSLLYTVYYRRIERATQREEGLLKRILEYSVPLTATRSANILDKKVDTILVGVLLNPTAVAYYTIGKQVSSMCKTPADALGFTIAPTYGEQKAKDHLERAARLYEQSFTYTVLLYVPAVIGILLTAEPLVLYVFGPDYLGAVAVLQLYSLVILLSALNQVTATGLDFLGRAKARAIVKSITAVANVLLNLLLIPIFGVVGAVMATLLTNAVYTSANIYIIAQELPIRLRPTLRTITGGTAVSIAMGGCVYLLLPYVDNILTFLAVVLIGVAIWATGVTLSGLVDVKRMIGFVG